MNLSELKVSGYLAQLIIAIEGNDVDTTKDLVGKINDLDVLSVDFPFRSFLNPNKITNEAAIYVASELKNVYNREELLWNYRLKQVSLTGNRDKVIEFLNAYKTKEALQQIQLYQVSTLFELCIDYNCYDILEEMRLALDEIIG